MIDKRKLEAVARAELVDLWGDLERACQRAANGHWSIECEGLVERIKALTEAVGPTHWGLIPLTLLEADLYQQIHATLGVDAPVDMEQVARCRAYSNSL